MAKLPILMYHNILPENGTGLTIAVRNFEKQCEFLASEKYSTYHCADLSPEIALQGRKNCMLTFDDGYVNQLRYAVPILQRYALKATFFVPLAYLGKTDEWNSGALDIMTADQLRSLPSETIELAYHSFNHQNYATLQKEEIKEDTQLCYQVVSDSQLHFTKVLAYPYGKFPKKEPERTDFQKQLAAQGFQLGFRIGNRVARFPFHKPYEVNRIDVKGEWSLSKFKRKIRYGKIF